VEGSASPATYVPYNYVHHRIKAHKDRNDVLNNVDSDNDTSDNDVHRSQTSEHMSWGSESPKTPWSQKKEQHHPVPQNSENIFLKIVSNIFQKLGLPPIENLDFKFVGMINFL
jgi:hypothetical protein